MVACFSTPTRERQSNLFLEPNTTIDAQLTVLTEPEQRQHNNRAILQDLERQRERLTYACYAAGVSAVAGFTFVTLATPALMIPLGVLLGKLQTISQQVFLMRRLIEAFEADGIEIYPRIDPPDLKQIDFFLRFPDKKFIVIKIGSQGKSVVSFNEFAEKLQYRKKGGGLKYWEPDPLSVLNLQVLWIGKERRDLKGGSSRDARRPVAKFFVLWGETKLAHHNEHLYSTMAGYRALWIRKFGAVCIVQEDQVIDAIKAYLSKEREQATNG